MNVRTAVTGFPRIGENRELKRTLENYWNGKVSKEELEKVGKELREKHWLIQKDKGIDLISCNDFSMYDNMLDTIVMLNAIPERFKEIKDQVEQYFAMARGNSVGTAMGMTKWFNTNYHYIVPELTETMEFSLNPSKIIAEYNEAKALGITPKINIIGPVTFLALSKTTDGTEPLSLYYNVIPIYEELISRLSELDETVYIQFDEPAFVKDPTKLQLELLEDAYNMLSVISDNVKIIVTTYFEHSNEATRLLSKSKVWGIGLDFIYGRDNLDSLKLIGDKKLIAGVVDGRNIWANDISRTIELLELIHEDVNSEQIIISTSCSMLHVPVTLKNESESEKQKWFAFAYEKLDELNLISRLFFEKGADNKLNELLSNNQKTILDRKNNSEINDNSLTRKIGSVSKIERDCCFSERIQLQDENLQLPILPTTTIGSFPQIKDLRILRRNFKNGKISEDSYENGIKDYISECIKIQEDIGLDVLVHGEPERNDMVEYFGELLNGFHFTKNGWVQSYGSRCVKPPIIFGDISRSEPMTVKWIKYAQSLTDKPVKGMLTGPVTILNWSFVRDDKSRSEVSKQIALVLSEEIDDLQNAGIKIIQVDEAAFKEGYPLRKNRISEYEKWAVENFKFAVRTTKPETQIHTHMCYSNFKEIIKTIESMDADVVTIETARSGNSLLKVFKRAGYKNEIGPGVYDIHSPRIPSVAEFAKQISLRIEVLPVNQLWINPDCGLKTRKWDEVKLALFNMVQAVKLIRKSDGV